MKQVFGWIFFVAFGVGGGIYAISELFALKIVTAVVALLWALFWLWLAGSYMLGLF